MTGAEGFDLAAHLKNTNATATAYAAAGGQMPLAFVVRIPTRATKIAHHSVSYFRGWGGGIRTPEC